MGISKEERIIEDRKTMVGVGALTLPS